MPFFGRRDRGGARPVLPFFDVQAIEPVVAAPKQILPPPISDEAMRQAAKVHAAKRLLRLARRPGWKIAFAGDGDELTLLLVRLQSPIAPAVQGWRRELVSNAVLRNELRRLSIRRLHGDGSFGTPVDATGLLDALAPVPGAVDLDLGKLAHPQSPAVFTDDAQQSLLADLCRVHAKLRPFLAEVVGAPPGGEPADSHIVAIQRFAAGLRAANRRLVPYARNGRVSLLAAPDAASTASGELLMAVGDFVAACAKATWIDVAPVQAGDAVIVPDLHAAREAVSASLRAYPLRAIEALAEALALRDASPGPTGRWSPRSNDPDIDRRRLAIAVGSATPALAPLLHELEVDPGAGPAPPYDQVPPPPPAVPQKRSVLFLHDSYYNFTYLSQALRARGWDAQVVTLQDPDAPQAALMHDLGWNLFRADPTEMLEGLRRFFTETRGRFGIVHGYGRGVLNLFPHVSDTTSAYDSPPWDILEWKRNGALIGYSHSGCLDMVSQTSFRRWSHGMCDRCVWKDNPTICSDDGNLAWGWKVNQIADLICAETEPLLDFKASEKTWREPLTLALDPEIWRPDLEPPEALLQLNDPNEIVVFHAVGNFDLRTQGGADVKGSGAVVEAIERLRAEGEKVRLSFAKNVPSREMRFAQIQADIVVDQLKYGRYGASAREAMMLGKPVVGKVEQVEPAGSPPSQCILETPIIDAREDTIYGVLKALIHDSERRRHVGQESRKHALKWWSAEPLAETFETVYDSVRRTGRPPR